MSEAGSFLTVRIVRAVCVVVPARVFSIALSAFASGVHLALTAPVACFIVVTGFSVFCGKAVADLIVFSLSCVLLLT
jgi:hypothetical protein